MEKIIAQGAEAIIVRNGQTILKKRISKGYRHTILDEKLRKIRTRSEAKLLEKASKVISVPSIKKINEQKKELELSYIPGKNLATTLEKKSNKKEIYEKIGKAIASLHNEGIIHGDLTTSNMIMNKSKLYLIDFGLGFHSHKKEDKAVDLHVLKEALEAKHPTLYEKAIITIVRAYTKNTKDASPIIKQLEKVEKRGRYKAQY